MNNMENKKYFKTCLKAVQQALIKEWDPIGVSDVPEAQDEYDSYAPKITGMLIEKKPRNEIFDYLWLLETDHMGLTGTDEARNATDKFVDRLIETISQIKKD